MKKFYITIMATLMSCGVFAQQQKVVIDSSPKKEKTSSYLSTKTDDATVTWLTDDIQVNSFGFNATGSIAAFMEVQPDDILNYNNTGLRLNTVEQVHFAISSDALSAVTECKVIIREGTNFTTSTEVRSQVVPITSLAGGWNYITLTEPLSTDVTKSLYIGYQIQISGGLPAAAAACTDLKQAWMIVNGTSYDNLIYSYGDFGWMIKALVATEDADDNEIKIVSFDTPLHQLQGTAFNINGTIKNLGITPLTKFKVSYQIAGEAAAATEEIIGLTVAPGATYAFSYPSPYDPQTAKAYDITITVSEPNGETDYEGNNTMSATVNVYSETVQRVVLHEGFSSSTCGPCKAGNETLKAVLDAAPKAKWASIKYQVDFPGSGDPYYTSEVNTRRSYYGVTTVPALIVDGPNTFNAHPGYYSTEIFNILAAIPAGAKMTATATVTGKTVDFSGSMTPVIELPVANLRFFAAIVEKVTTNNKKSNGETKFYYVMKKFMTSVNGDPIDTWVLNTPKQFTNSYTFNGNYRLPANASDPINNDTENSVENFDYLMVVYWIQNVLTGDIIQAGTADPNPAGIAKVNGKDNNISVFPNPARDQFTVQSEVPFTNITLINMAGKTVKEIQTNNGTEYKVNVGGLTKGSYILQVNTKQGISVQKIQIQ